MSRDQVMGSLFCLIFPSLSQSLSSLDPLSNVFLNRTLLKVTVFPIKLLPSYTAWGKTSPGQTWVFFLFSIAANLFALSVGFFLITGNGSVHIFHLFFLFPIIIYHCKIYQMWSNNVPRNFKKSKKTPGKANTKNQAQFWFLKMKDAQLRKFKKKRVSAEDVYVIWSRTKLLPRMIFSVKSWSF